MRLLDDARRWQTQGACSSLPPALGWRVLAAASKAPAGRCSANGSRHESPTDRASLWLLLNGARRWQTQGACSSLPPALEWRVLAAATNAPAGIMMLCNGSRHEALTDRASLRLLLHDARRWQTQGACSSLPPTLGWRVLAAVSQAPAGILMLLQRKPP